MVGPLGAAGPGRSGSVCKLGGWLPGQPPGSAGWGCVIQDSLCLPQPQPSCVGSCSLPPIPTLPGRLVSLPTATRLFGIDGGDLGDPGHLDHPFGVLPQLQVPQGRVQQVPDHLIVDLMGQVGRGRGQMLTGDQGRAGGSGNGQVLCPSRELQAPLRETLVKEEDPFLPMGWA